MKHIIIFLFLIFTLTTCKRRQPEGPSSVPTLSTQEANNITAISCVTGGSIVYNGNNNILRKGICYGRNSQPTLIDSIIQYGGDGDIFTLVVTNLLPNTTYYARAFATNTQGTGYANNQIIFKTLVSAPILDNLSLVEITSTSAVLKGEILYNGGGSVTSKGICFSTSPNATVQNNVLYSSGITDTFSIAINGLNPETTYYIRAFAYNETELVYSSEKTITTPYQLFGIGYTYQGGIIFYIDDSGTHGLLAAPTDQSTNTGWGCAGITLSGANSTLPGGGVQNTLDIIGGCPSADIAAYYCNNLSLSGYTDWYLPSKEELQFMYQNLHATGKGNFSNLSYWSSTQTDANTAWGYHFGNNTQSSSNKNSPFAVRAIRAF